MTQTADRLRSLSAALLFVTPEELTAGARLSDDLGIDSLAAIEWGMVIEDELGVLLPEVSWRDLATYGDVETFVLRASRASTP